MSHLSAYRNPNNFRGKIQGKAVIVVDEKQIEEEKKLGAKY